MLKKHKNRFLEIIEECGLDPENFKAYEEYISSYSGFIIEVVNSQLKFEVIVSNNSYEEFNYRYIRFGPNYTLTEFNLDETWEAFRNTTEAFEQWIVNHVKDYTDEQTLPDLWAQLEQQREFIPSAKMEKDDTLPYSEEEKAQLRLSINEFRLQIVNNFDHNEDQLKIIDDRLTYLSEALDRLNRVDWKAVALSSIISISTALSLNTEKGELLFNLFKQIFSKIVYLLN